MADTKLVICEKCLGTGHVNGGDENSTWSKTCEDCHGIGFSRVPMTNADRYRAMSDEELAKQIVHTSICDQCMKVGVDCVKCLLEWLKQPMEEVSE